MFHLLKILFSWTITFFGEIEPKKMANQSTHIKKKQYAQSGISENTDGKQVIIEMELESINLSATNGTFVTKGEIESNFLTTLTDEPKLNHWVNTIFNKLVIQVEPSSRCI